MKQLLSLALALLPCLAWAQYPSNGNQKITLGEQTTADGLIWRGLAADTTLTAKSDTAAYFVLDTANLNLYTYKASASGKKWRQIGADTAAIAYVNTYGTQTVNGAKTFSSTVTGAKFSVTDSIVTGNGMYLFAANTLGFSTFGTGRVLIDSSGFVAIGTSSTNLIGGNTFAKNLTIAGDGTQNNADGRLILANPRAYASMSSGVTTAGRIFFGLPNVSGGTTIQFASIDAISSGSGGTGGYGLNLRFSPKADNGNQFVGMTLNASGNLGLGTQTPQSGYRLHVVDSVYVGGNVSAAAYTTRSDYNLKDDIFNLKYGLNEILNLQPVEYIYKSNGSKQLGFIAQDIGTILPEVVSFEESMAVNYQAIIPILTKAIQEQNKLIKQLEQRIINLENK